MNLIFVIPERKGMMIKRRKSFIMESICIHLSVNVSKFIRKVSFLDAFILLKLTRRLVNFKTEYIFNQL